VSLGLIGRLVCEHLRPFDVRILAYDPLVTLDDARGLGVTLCSLEEIFATAQVVSLHAPLLPETAGLVTGAHLARLPAGATVINAARAGASCVRRS
jgi:phosphoglycerate dehydrogenase-like enzyme